MQAVNGSELNATLGVMYIYSTEDCKFHYKVIHLTFWQCPFSTENGNCYRLPHISLEYL